MKHLLSFLCFYLFITPLFAQNCVPATTITVPGIYADGLDTAIVDEPYEATIHVLALSDTNVVFSGSEITALIDSVRLDTVLGLPNGFTYACEPPSCTFTSEAVGCLKLSGNPVLSDKGVHPLNIKTTAFARWGALRLPVRDSIQEYSLVVVDANGSVSVNPISTPQFKVYPNPNSTGIFTLNSNRIIKSYSVYTSNGQLLLRKEDVNEKRTSINLNSCIAGVYTVYIQSENGVYTLKLTKL